MNPTVDKNISVELDEGDIMVELVRFVVLLVYGHLDGAEVLWRRGAVAVLVAVSLTPQVVLSHSHPGADNTIQRGKGVRGFALRHFLLLLLLPPLPTSHVPKLGYQSHKIK